MEQNTNRDFVWALQKLREGQRVWRPGDATMRMRIGAILRQNSNGNWVKWVPTVADMLANDWVCGKSGSLYRGFAWALLDLKDGRMVRRAMWPDESKHLLADASEIYFISDSGSEPWQPTQEDILAEDWERWISGSSSR